MSEVSLSLPVSGSTMNPKDPELDRIRRKLRELKKELETTERKIEKLIKRLKK